MVKDFLSSHTKLRGSPYIVERNEVSTAEFQRSPRNSKIYKENNPFYFVIKMPVDIETLHMEMQEIRKEIQELKTCFHEDFLELSDETKKDIEEARREIKEGKFLTEEEAKKKLGL